MNSPIEKLIDGINLYPSQSASHLKKQALSKATAKKLPYSSGQVYAFINNTSCQALFEHTNCQSQDYIQVLKTLRSELNTLIRKYDNQLIQINEHPMYQLFQIDSSGQLPTLMADKMFIDSLSEKISEDIPAQDFAKLMAIEIESKPILSATDINEKIAKTSLLKALVALINEGSAQILHSMMTASQTGQLSSFITKLISNEKKVMHSLQVSSRSLESDKTLLKQAKTIVNQQLRQLRKQFKFINQQYPCDTPLDIVHKASKISESLLQSQQTLQQAFLSIQMKVSGNLNLLLALKV